MSRIKTSPPAEPNQPASIAKLFYSTQNPEAAIVSSHISSEHSTVSQWGSRLEVQRFTRPGLWFLGLTVIVFWAKWNGILLLATILGMGTMITVYQLPRSNWQQYRSLFYQLFSPANRLLTGAVLSGGLVAVGSYWMMSLLSSGENIWVVLSLILQNGGIFAIAALLIWQLLQQQTHQTQSSRHQLLTELTHQEALHRLIAVRKLTQLTLRYESNTPSKTSTTILTRSQLAECFRLMLRTEVEPLVRNGILDGLQQLEK
ncbi:MAG: hypothetical protein WBA77_08950 [Microcoleaceae cyanobacterium]